VSIPARIRIGAHEYSVRVDQDIGFRGANGETYPERLDIIIAEGLAATREREVVLHETLHGVWQGTNLRTEESGLQGYEEQVASALAPVLLDMLRDNPDLVSYLCE
jgi:hypothetical protein